MELVKEQTKPARVDKPKFDLPANYKKPRVEYVQYIKGNRFSTTILATQVADTLQCFLKIHGDPSDTASAQIWRLGDITMEKGQEKWLSLYTERDAKNRLVWHSVMHPEWCWPIYKS